MNRHNLVARHSLLWPSLVAVAFACFYVTTQPGQIHADAEEYDLISRSILQGRYELREAFSDTPEPTMHREPGYPAFRALVYATVGDRPVVILWIQALLSGLAVTIAACTIRRVDPRWALPVAWFTALYPGFAVWAGQHYAETLAAFLVAVTGYAWIRVWEGRDDVVATGRWRTAAAFGVILGILALTKAAFQVLPLVAAGFLLVTGSWRTRWKTAVIILFAFGIVITPWIIRNTLRFDQPSITYRTGIVLYTRALKAEIPWVRMGTSAGSVLFGQATMIRFFPEVPPVVTQLWQQTWEDKNALLHQGFRFYQADEVLFQRARDRLFASPAVMARYALWSPIDDLRLFGLASPFSPKFGVEHIFIQQARDGSLTFVQSAIVLAAHAAQLVWWGFILMGALFLIRERKWGHPSLLIVGYVAMLYAPFDNIPRYAVPILPWIIALIIVALWPPHSSRRTGATSSHPRILLLAESLNSKSGWGTYAHQLLTALRKAGMEVTALTAHGSSEGMRLPDPHASWILWRLTEWRLRWWLRTHAFDVVHVTAEVYAQLFPSFGSMPFVVTVHSTYADPAAYGPYAKRLHEAYAHAAQIVAISQQTRDRVPDVWKEKVTVIPNGVDASLTTEPFDPAPSHGSPLILSVGAIKPRKGFDRLLVGFAAFRNTHPDAELVIVGRADRPDTREALVRLAASLGINRSVRFLGEVSRSALLGWYRACSAFALLPVEDGGSEGFGLVYLEANAFGKPCVGSRGSAGEEVIRVGETGFVVPADDPLAIADALTRTPALNPDRIRSSLAGQTWDDRGEAYQSLYTRVRNLHERPAGHLVGEI